MFSRSAWLHLRIPFSYFLLPVFLFSVAVSPNPTGLRLFWVFFIVHILLYPASNGYNSYFDKDEKSIGGLKNPPPVNKGLYFLALAFDALAVFLGIIMISLTFGIMLLVYGLVSKAYSHPAIRLKKYPIVGWLTAGIFQGFFTVIMCYVGINDFDLEAAFNDRVIWAAALATLMLLANYPMTQIYQHDEDALRGDITFSLILGVRGTFFFVGGIFALVFGGFFWYYLVFFNIHYSWIFALALTPIIVYFGIWLLAVLKNKSAANYSRTMWLNFISATCLNAFFMYLFLDSTHILNVL